MSGCLIFEEHDWDWDVDFNCKEWEFWGKNFVQSVNEDRLGVKLICPCGEKAIQWYKKTELEEV